MRVNSCFEHSVELHKILKICITKRLGSNNMNYYVGGFFHFRYSNPHRQSEMLHFARKLFQKHFRHCCPWKELLFSRSNSPSVGCEHSSSFGSLAWLRLYNNKVFTRGFIDWCIIFPQSRKDYSAQFYLEEKSRKPLLWESRTPLFVSVWEHWEHCHCLYSSQYSWRASGEELYSSKELDAPEETSWSFQSLGVL